jgi:peptidyl-prolyl cis-trans isomerase C
MSHITKLIKYKLFYIGFIFSGLLVPTQLSAGTDTKSLDLKANPATIIVAMVAENPIYLSEIHQMAQRLPEQYKKMSLDAVYPSLLTRAIDAKLVSLEGRKSGFSEDIDVKKRLSEIEGQIISEVFLTKTIGAQVTESALRKIYQETKSQMAGDDQVKARHILLDGEEKALQILKKLKNGEEFSKLASEYSTGPSAASGGDLGWFGKRQMVPAFSEAAFALSPGDIVTQPVKTQFGWHIIMVEDRRTAEPPSFKEAQEQLASNLSQTLLKQLIETLRKKSKIERFQTDGTPNQVK